MSNAADDPMPESETTNDGDGEALNSDKLRKVWETALTEFDAVAVPQVELRAESLEDRRFTTITGAMWEGPWGIQAENSPRPELDKISKAKDKIKSDMNENRMVVDFVPGDKGDEMTADTLDGVYLADCDKYDAQEARDNAITEGIGGGFGAWRLSTDYEDPSDPDNDKQRVIPGLIIPDADKSVYFYGGCAYDKSDAESAFIIVRDLLPIAEEKWGKEALTPWPSNQWRWIWDWYTPEVACIAEYYKVEKVTENRLIFTNPLTDEEKREWESKMKPQEVRDLVTQGWKKRVRKHVRKRVHKYILNGTGILKDCGYIAGENIPIVPYYGNREWVDNQERWWGYTRKRKDRQRIFNTAMGSYVETASLSPRDIPILEASQYDDAIAEAWASANIERKPFLPIKAMRDENGQVISAGPIGKVDAPQPAPAQAQLLQIVMAEAADDNQNVEEVRSNTSYEAMDLAASRVDERSSIYIDNAVKSLKREGVIYESMAGDVYCEEGREVDTRTAEGQDGKAVLYKEHVDDQGVIRTINDFSTKYNVIATVQRSTATVRQKTVNDCLRLAEVAAKSGNNDLANVLILQAAANMDGEGMTDTKDWIRQQQLKLGAVKPTKEEQQQIEQAAQSQQPDPAQAVAQADIAETQSKVAVNEAKAQQTLADAALKMAQAQAVGGPVSAPDTPSGLDDPAHPNNVVSIVGELAGAQLKEAQARKIDHDIGHQRIKSDREQEQEAHQREMDRRDRDLAERTAN